MSTFTFGTLSIFWYFVLLLVAEYFCTVVLLLLLKYKTWVLLAPLEILVSLTQMVLLVCRLVFSRSPAGESFSQGLRYHVNSEILGRGFCFYPLKISEIIMSLIQRNRAKCFSQVNALHFRTVQMNVQQKKTVLLWGCDENIWSTTQVCSSTFMYCKKRDEMKTNGWRGGNSCSVKSACVKVKNTKMWQAGKLTVAHQLTTRSLSNDEVLRPVSQVLEVKRDPILEVKG